MKLRHVGHGCFGLEASILPILSTSSDYNIIELIYEL
jgi:hypothetical protein